MIKAMINNRLVYIVILAGGVTGCGGPQAGAENPDREAKRTVVIEPLEPSTPTPEVVKAEQEPKLIRVTGPLSKRIRDERRIRHSPRRRRLLITELANIERLYRSTPRKSPDRPALLRRLAEGYVELSAAGQRDATKAKDDQQRAELKKSRKIVKVARRNAIKYYTKLKKQYPKWCQFPSSKPGERGCADEALYYLAYEYELAGRLDQARKCLLELIDNWPISKFIPYGYLAIGELFFDEAKADPSKWVLATKFYAEVLKYPPPKNRIWGYACFMQAFTLLNQQRRHKAIENFDKVVQFGAKYPDLPGATELVAMARRELAKHRGK